MNGKPRTRLHAEEMVALVERLGIPPGTVVHLEEGGVVGGMVTLVRHFLSSTKPCCVQM